MNPIRILLTKVSACEDLRLIFILAVAIRIIYAFLFHPMLPGVFNGSHPDTSTFLNAFINLVEHGRYCFDLDVPDSCFYRHPTYPFFLGSIVYIFQSSASTVITITQSVLDSLTVVLGCSILTNLKVNSCIKRVAVAFYIVNPFTLFWITVHLPEIAGVFLSVLAIWLASRRDQTVWTILLLAFVVVLAVWAKQYIAAILIAIPFYLAVWGCFDITKKFGLFLIFFLALYSPWVARNYINYHELNPVIGKSTGSRHYLSDMKEAMAFLGIFYVNFNPERDHLAKTGEIRLPDSPFVDQNRERIDAVAREAFRCGPSFASWRGEHFVYDASRRECEERVAKSFQELRYLAGKQLPFQDYYSTAFLGFFKGFYKYDLDLGASSAFVQAPLFLLRFFLVILGLSAVFLASTSFQRRFAFGSAIFWLSTLGVLAFVLRHVEMRYLLMADMGLFLSAAISLSYLYTLWIVKKK